MTGILLGFAILAIFVLARRMNRDEDIIVDLRSRVQSLETACGISNETQERK